jgi:hypothetical protein
MHPFPSDKELELFYRSYWKDDEADIGGKFYRLQAEARCRFFMPFVVPSGEVRVMDFGAGFGFVQDVLQQLLSSEVVLYDAVEVDPVAVGHLRKFVRRGSVYSSLEETDKAYHVMIVAHVLEHMIDPAGFLREQHCRMEEGGVLYIETPNQDYLFKKANQPHLFFFTPGNLRRMVTESGYQVLRLETCGGKLSDLSRSSLLKTLKNIGELCMPARLSRLIKKVFYKKASDSVIRDRWKFEEYGPERRWIRLVAMKDSRYA